MLIKATRLACVLALVVCAGARVAAQSALPGTPPTVDLNIATFPQLLALPGVTLEVANQIVAHRPYDSVEQFRTKSGLAASLVDKLAPLVSAQKPVSGPVRQPKLPPGAVPISPEQFQKGFTLPSTSAVPGGVSRGSSSVPGILPGLVPGADPGLVPGFVPGVSPGFVPGGAPPVPARPGAATPVPVQPGTYQRIPVPQGIVKENIPVPGAPPSPPPGISRVALAYAAAAVAVALAVIVWGIRTSPTRRATRAR